VNTIGFIFWIEAARELPSWALFAVGILASAWVVVVTTLDSLTRVGEDRAKLSKSAKIALGPEIAKNIALVKKMRDGFHSGSSFIQSLDVRAWERISTRGALLGLRAEEIQDLIRVYALIYRTNAESNRLFESVPEVASTSSNEPRSVAWYVDKIRASLDELQPALEELNQNLSSS
jgi:hypothetical protein